MKFIDVCSGIGGFRSALENNGHECLAFAEIDKYAKQSYRAIYDTDGEEDLDDITTITDEHFRFYRGRCDIITGGFPCQTFSIAGNRRGFDDTRGTIFFHIARAIKEIQPSYVLLENVKGLLSHDKGRTFGTIIQALDELGYVTEWGLFNSKYWGVPQNRERVYILVTRKNVYNRPKLFDLLKQQTEVTTRLIDVLEDEVDEKYYLSEEKTKKLTLDIDLGGKLNMYDYNERDKVHSVNKVSPTLNTMQGGDRQPKIAIKQIGNIADNKETFGGNPQQGRVYNPEGLSPTLNCMRGGGLEPKIAVREATKQGVVMEDKGIRFTDDGFHTHRKDEKKSSIQGTHVTYKEGRTHALTSNHVPMTIDNINDVDVNQGVFIDNTLNFYAKDNVVYDEEQYKKLVKANNDFEVDYIYVEPTLYQLDEKHILLINNDQNQFEIIEIREGYYLTLKVESSLDELNLTTYKKEYGRFGKQAIETLNDNKDVINDGMTVNAYNKTLDDSGLSPTLTTRPEGFKTAILPITNGLRIRKLTPLECWRLQGFTDEQFYKAKESGVSNSQLYKQAGNSVSVPVVDAIVKCL
ncbi:DNA (cytosine-5-)-methyltransferase [Staphylococcus cohnii]|uniref:DNA (cytosine-5-)-methyltransferase n=1 Tax=Staphylococcus cohnii TaxID=29382 RepID=UPI003D7CE891